MKIICLKPEIQYFDRLNILRNHELFISSHFHIKKLMFRRFIYPQIGYFHVELGMEIFKSWWNKRSGGLWPLGLGLDVFLISYVRFGDQTRLFGPKD